MSRCLNERALFDILSGDGSAAQHAHLRLCAECAERYDALRDDVQSISGTLLQGPPPARAASRVQPMLVRWVPLGAAATALLVAGLALTLLRAPTLVPQAVSSANVPAFADDVSAALFAGGDDSEGTLNADDAPYLQAALDTGVPCTPDRFFDGECEDQVVALVLQ